MASDQSVFGNLEIAPDDSIFGLQKSYVEDTHPQKVNLGVGVYRGEDAKPYSLPVVTSVEIAMASDKTLNHEYLPISGLKDFCEAATKLALGSESTAIVENRVCSVQALSGTGSLFLGVNFLQRFFPSPTIYIPKPTWGNHRKVCSTAGYKDIREYRYVDPKTNGLDAEGMLEDLKNAPDGSVIILHACAHNPSGVDPKKEEWERVADIMKEKKHYTLFDMAYQGFVSGDPDTDAMAIRLFVSRGMEMLCAQSFAKIFGIYNERAGNLLFVCSDSKSALAVHSQLCALIRPMYSNPPNHGARIVATILNNPALMAEWKDQLRAMADRIRSSRKVLYEKLKALGTPGSWQHILNQCGMFTFTGLSPKQVDQMIRKHHIYLLKNGRINMCGINPSNADYVAQAIHDCVTNSDASL